MQQNYSLLNPCEQYFVALHYCTEGLTVKLQKADKFDQLQSRTETIDYNIFSSANEMSCTEQGNLNLFARCEKFWLYSVNVTTKF